jgi:hypothetical protein
LADFAKNSQSDKKSLMNLQKIKENFWLQFLFLMLAVFAFVGKTVPYGNEPIYLLRLVKTYQPNYLPNDLSFSTSASEHWLFNHLFGLLSIIFSVQTLAWVSRISVWIILLFALFRLAKHWKISNFAVTISIFIWLAIGQTIVNGEWIFGGFEAKNLAYIFLIFALDYFLQKREIIASILLGLSFSFHPAVGLWAILAVGITLIFERYNFKTIWQVIVITGLFSLIGLVNLFHETKSNSEDWKFFVIERAPFHLDPFSWLVKGFILIALMFAFCYLASWNSFLKNFLIALGVFFLIGFVLRFFEQWQFLCLMPMRLLPVFLPLFFFFTLAKTLKDKSFSTLSAFIVILVFINSLWWQKSELLPIIQIRETLQTWNTKVDDETKTYLWLRENSPNDALILSPPNNRNIWFYSNRSQFANFSYPPFEKMTEWRERLKKIAGGNYESKVMSAFYKNLSQTQIDEICKNNQISYLVSEAKYDYPLVFESGNWKVYKLNGN